MPKIAQQLSARAVDRLRRPGRHPVGGAPGLQLRVTPTGHRAWVLRITVGERRLDLGLGSFPAVSLADARDAARAARERVRSGELLQTPAQRQRLAGAAANKTFAECAEALMQDKALGWKNAKHRQQWVNTLKSYAYPHLGSMPVAAIDLPDILACLEPIWREKTETASRLRGRIEAVLDWATVRKYRSGENPARWKGHLDKVLPAPAKIAHRAHQKALAVDAAPAFMRALRTRPGMAARALEFAILTAARSGEVRGAAWGEINLEAKVWTVPAERMKAGKEHRVPLSDTALALLAALPRLEGSELVFPGGRGQPLSDMSLTSVTRRMKAGAVPHGFRSTFRDWAGDRTTFARDLAEAALAHALPNAVEAAYRRGDALERRRSMMQAWAEFLRDREKEKEKKGEKAPV